MTTTPPITAPAPPPTRLTLFGADPLTPALAAAVPLAIADLLEKGGPDAADYAAMPEIAQRLACEGDVLLYGGKPGEAAALFALLARAVAVLAFCPGGATAFGGHWEAHAPGRPRGIR